MRTVAAAVLASVLGSANGWSAQQEQNRYLQLSERETAAVMKSFGLPACPRLLRLPDVISKGYLIESWQSIELYECDRVWHERVYERYNLGVHLDKTNPELRALPWVCFPDDGAHTAWCERAANGAAFRIEWSQYSQGARLKRSRHLGTASPAEGKALEVTR